MLIVSELKLGKHSYCLASYFLQVGMHYCDLATCMLATTGLLAVG